MIVTQRTLLCGRFSLPWCRRISNGLSYECILCRWHMECLGAILAGEARALISCWLGLLLSNWGGDSHSKRGVKASITCHWGVGLLPDVSPCHWKGVGPTLLFFTSEIGIRLRVELLGGLGIITGEEGTKSPAQSVRAPFSLTSCKDGMAVMSILVRGAQR